MGSAEPLLEIGEVSLAELDETELCGRELRVLVDGDEGEARAGSTFALYALGWVLGRRLAATEVSFVHDATALWRVPIEVERTDVAAAFPAVRGAERSGFYATVSSLPLPREFELVVRARLSDGETALERDLGIIRGRRAALRPAFEPRIDPLMVTTFSRTGSNLVLRLLGSHPEVVAYRPFQHEPRVLTYWMEAFRELTEPASYLRQVTSQGAVAERGWWLGIRTPMPRRLFDREIQRDLALDAVEDAASFCQRRIERVYGRIAAGADRPEARYFAEKQLPSALPTIAWELYPAAKELFLVRDFRDMIASVLAWRARFGGRWFGHAAAGGDEEFVRSFSGFVTNLLASWRRRSARAHLLRYEDLLRDPETTVEALIGYLGLDTPGTVRRRMIESLQERSSRSEQYRTSESPAASIGRWRRDLDPRLRPVVEQVFAPALELFGYERPNSGA